MIALREAYQAGLFAKQNWLPNVLSGLIVGVVALPLALAFAIAIGVNPEQGIYTAIIAGLCVAIFGGSRVQIAGPTGAFIIILAHITANHGVDGLQMATLMAGFILIAFGLARFGAIIKYIPDPVIIGFTAGIALIIWVSQWQHFFGLPIHINPTSPFHETLPLLIQALPQFNLATMLIASLSLLLTIYAPRFPGLKRIPGPLTAMIAATLIQSLFQFTDVLTIGKAYGALPQHLPNFQLPSIHLSEMPALIGPAFTIAMLGAIESLLSAVVADGMLGTRHQSNQELIGQGLANLLAPLFGGFAATGAIARTATNIRNGGNSPLAGIVHAITLLVILFCLAPLAANIPLGALAGILFVVAWNMSEAKHIVRIIRRAPIADTLILIVTFGLTVLVDLVVAVNIGVILATLYFLHRMATSVEVQHVTEAEIHREMQSLNIITLPAGVLVYAVEGPFFFGAVEIFERALQQTHTDPKVIIIRLKWVPFIDLTGLQTLEEVIQKFKTRGVMVMLSGARPKVIEKLKRAGIVDLISKDYFFADFQDALLAAINKVR